MSTMLPLLLDGERLALMSQAARSTAHPHADEELAGLVLGAAR
jgi:UDP-N-acetylglucosamine:LPS N-acetylglucosamine transferase